MTNKNRQSIAVVTILRGVIGPAISQTSKTSNNGLDSVSSWELCT